MLLALVHVVHICRLIQVADLTRIDHRNDLPLGESRTKSWLPLVLLVAMESSRSMQLDYCWADASSHELPSRP